MTLEEDERVTIVSQDRDHAATGTVKDISNYTWPLVPPSIWLVIEALVHIRTAPLDALCFALIAGVLIVVFAKLSGMILINPGLVGRRRPTCHPR